MGDIDWKFLFTSFEGRINRQLWWTGIGVIFGGSVIARMIFGNHGIIPIVLGIIFLITGLALHIKRCHDRDKSGWWCLLLIVPLVGVIWAIVELGILEGVRGPNEYGPDPLGRRRGTGDASL